MTVPTPLTPPDCDLRDFGFMPFDVVRFDQSDLVAMEEPEAVLAAIRLWGKAWHAVPAGSLTDDDRALANLAGYGRAVGEFLRVKDGALRGFVKCSDGRLYHPVVAEKARESWRQKLQQRWRSFTAAVRKHNERHPNDKRAAPSFDQWVAAGRPTAVTPDSAPPERETDQYVTRDILNGHAGPDEQTHRQFEDTSSKGRESKGRVKGRDIYIDDEGGDAPARILPVVDPFDLAAFADRCARAAGVANVAPRTIGANVQIVKEWLDHGATHDEILATIGTAQAAAAEPINSLRYFAAAVRQTVARRENQANGTGPSIAGRPADRAGPRPGSRAAEMDDAVRAVLT